MLIFAWILCALVAISGAIVVVLRGPGDAVCTAGSIGAWVLGAIIGDAVRVVGLVLLFVAIIGPSPTLRWVARRTSRRHGASTWGSNHSARMPSTD
ncbi:MAG: hypothetical protein MUF80_02300 [Burkholderiales bacterium]|jgi:hypothetical protein|nr:hypothetical protein [Burkholderiales bacterium]